MTSNAVPSRPGEAPPSLESARTNSRSSRDLEPNGQRPAADARKDDKSVGESRGREGVDGERGPSLPPCRYTKSPMSVLAEPREQRAFSSQGRLIIVANRLPMNFSKDSKGEWTSSPAAGGLVSAMKGVKVSRMTWIGWPGTEIPESEHETIRKKCIEQNCYPVFLSKDLAEYYYNGFSNHVLWPLFHYINVNIEDTTTKSDRQWQAYYDANSLFADAVLQVYEEDDIVWTHDYHLMMLPSILRQQRPQMKIGWFLHTPFPSSEIYRALPWREELLNGVLAADLVGFHIFDYGRHFKSACTRILGLEVTYQGVEHHGRHTQVATVPIGIDADRFIKALDSSAVKEEFADLQRKFKGMKVLLGIDRLDYIKGIPHKILAVERFLQHHPEWIGKIVLIQIAVPSRETVLEYQRLKSVTHELVGRVNGRFGTLESVPIHYLDQGIPFPKMCALYRLADIAIITSLRDGMNLVSFEYVTCQRNKPDAGVLILSEFAGAAQSLGAGAIRINPWNTNQMAEALHQALKMPVEERRQLHHYAFQHVTTYTAQRWAQQFLSELQTTCQRTMDRAAMSFALSSSPPLPVDQVVQSFAKSKNRMVCLGVVGCLTQKRMRGVTVEQFCQMARVPQPTLEAIKRLSEDPNTTVLIMTALGRAVIDRLVGSTKAWLVPENGFFIRKGGRDSEWETLGDNVDLSWINEVEEVMDYFVQRTPRSFIEREESYLSWHYRDSDSEWAKLQARDLLVHLMATPASSHGFEIVRGVKAVQVRPIGVSKGFAAQHCIVDIERRTNSNIDFILCVGSFLFRDEDLFTSLLQSPFVMQEPEDALDLNLVNQPPASSQYTGPPSARSLSPSTPGDLRSNAGSCTNLAALAIPPPLLNADRQGSPPITSDGKATVDSNVAPLRKHGSDSGQVSPEKTKDESPDKSVFTFRSSPTIAGAGRTSPRSRPLSLYSPRNPRTSPRRRSSSRFDLPSEVQLKEDPRTVFTCTVGRKPSRAQYYVNGIHDVSQLLQRMCATLPPSTHVPSAVSSTGPTASRAPDYAPSPRSFAFDSTDSVMPDTE